MRFKYKLPDVSETGSDIEILEWHVPEGGHMVEYAPLLEIGTDKATLELPCPVTGTVIRHLVSVGDTVTAGTQIAELESE